MVEAGVTCKGKILVVDDDRLVLATVTHGLAQAGYDVIDADNGDDAILLANEHRPGLALLDIRMEGMSGFDVAATLRDSYQIPFLFLSAFADEATAAEVKRLGALAHLIKPVDVGQIVPAVATAFASIEAQRAASPSTALPARAPRSDAAGAAAARATGTQPAAAGEQRADDEDAVPLAVGVLMQRDSLTRGEARQRLQRMAVAAGLTECAQAERLLAAIETLARSAG